MSCARSNAMRGVMNRGMHRGMRCATSCRVRRSRWPWFAPASLAALLACVPLAPGCIVLHDRAGVNVPQDAAATIELGHTTREELLARLGPPTGHFSTDLLASLTRLNAPIEAPVTAGRVDDDVLTWQAVDVRAVIAFFPVLFAWADSEVTSRTLTVFFDEQGRARYAAFREDQP